MKDVETWLSLAAQRYDIARHSANDPARLAELRVAITDRLDEYRQGYRSRAGRLWAAQRLEISLGDVISDELRDGQRSSHIFAMVESLKARLLLDQMSTARRELPSPELQAEATAYEHSILHFKQGKRGGLLSTEMSLASQLSIGMIGKKEDERERGLVLSSLEKLLREYDAGMQGGETICSLSEVMSALHHDEVLIEYFIPYHFNHPAMEVWIIAITSLDVRVISASLSEEYLTERSVGLIGRISIDNKAPIDSSPLGDAVLETRTHIQRMNEFESIINLHELYELLITPLLKNGIVPERFLRWVVVPHGMLNYVPFAALQDSNGRALIENVALITVPSASVWYRLQSHTYGRPATFLGFANPSQINLSPLPETESEVEQICEILEGVECQVYKREAATESRLIAEAAGKSILHFATHGAFPEENAIDFHQLLLSPASGHDGLVHAEELRRLDLHSTHLVVLNICNGGLYRFGPGNEPYGMIAALLGAGAQNVLSTLWPIEDEMGRKFITNFYQHLLESGPAKALQEACKDFIQQGESICDWAAFTLVGVGRPAV